MFEWVFGRGLEFYVVEYERRSFCFSIVFVKDLFRVVLYFDGCR